MIQYALYKYAALRRREKKKSIDIHYSKPDVNASFEGSIKRS